MEVSLGNSLVVWLCGDKAASLVVVTVLWFLGLVFLLILINLLNLSLCRFVF